MNAIDHAIERLIVVYGEPRTSDPAQYEAEIRRCLHGFAPVAIDKAVGRWIDGETPFWPRPGELRAIANRVATEMAPRRPAEHEPIPERPPMTAEQRARHAALMAEFRAAMAAIQVELGGGDCGTPKVDWKRGQRPAFEAMQRNSPNRGLHMRPDPNATSRPTAQRRLLAGDEGGLEVPNEQSA